MRQKRGNMQQDALMLYKLIVLYMLNRVAFSLTAAQVSDFILEKEYTNFLTLQQTLSELAEAGMISQKPARNRTLLTITPEGQNTLYFFENRINDGIKEDINLYLKDKAFELRNETSVSGHYDKAVSGEYEARLTAKERGITLVDITLSVPGEETASAICDNWQKKNQEIYQYLARELF